jgi:hypothetical protein
MGVASEKSIHLTRSHKLEASVRANLV